jgi:hypothetical protein
LNENKNIEKTNPIEKLNFIFKKEVDEDSFFSNKDEKKRNFGDIGFDFNDLPKKKSKF